ncbi:MAG TPA: DJ-1/PfpI family protein [Methanocella sp.]|uniref:DJ-1/PfpI family protein n=1 Tax=Methanocella sp. TaxID=2052833 RepID=UPI002CEA5DA3|nr:DJ-1/PfpI family protein [Methanocella sp.]HTY91718.1 DJ-1/PfpI family protein [Methanocella sp.]
MEFDLGNTEIVLVAAPEGFRDEELFVPEDVFSAAGAFVLTASTTKKTINGSEGGSTDPDLHIEDINVDDLNALVIAGGRGARQYLWNDEALLRKVSEANEKGKIIGAICISGAIPAIAGIMRGRKGTVYPDPEALEVLKKAGETYVGEGVVVDGNVVTGAGPEYAKEFAGMILALLYKRIQTTVQR